MRTFPIFVVVLLAVAVVAGGGCSDILDSDSTGAVEQSAGSVPERHDIAITAVDADPPWISRLAMPNTALSLLAVVENKGNVKESGIVVEASLYSSGRERLLLYGVSTINELAPGQSEVVRFGPFFQIPASSSYILEVEAKPVPFEELRANNLRMFQFPAP